MSTLALLPHPDSRPICSGHSTSWNSAMKETHYSRHTHAINKPIYYILLALDDRLSIIIPCADEDQRPLHILAIHVLHTFNVHILAKTFPNSHLLMQKSTKKYKKVYTMSPHHINS